MKLDFFLIADYVDSDEENKLSIVGAGISHIQVSELPTTVPRLAAVARFLLEETDPEADRPFRVQLRLLRPDGTPAGESDVREIPPEETRRRRFHEGEEHAAFFVVRLDGLQLNQSGAYRLVLWLGDRAVAERPLAVVRAVEWGNEGAT